MAQQVKFSELPADTAINLREASGVMFSQGKAFLKMPREWFKRRRVLAPEIGLTVLGESTAETAVKAGNPLFFSDANKVSVPSKKSDINKPYIGIAIEAAAKGNKVLFLHRGFTVLQLYQSLRPFDRWNNFPYLMLKIDNDPPYFTDPQLVNEPTSSRRALGNVRPPLVKYIGMVMSNVSTENKTARCFIDFSHTLHSWYNYHYASTGYGSSLTDKELPTSIPGFG